MSGPLGDSDTGRGGLSPTPIHCATLWSGILGFCHCTSLGLSSSVCKSWPGHLPPCPHEGSAGVRWSPEQGSPRQPRRLSDA